MDNMDNEEIQYSLNCMIQALSMKEHEALKSLRLMMTARQFMYHVDEKGNISLRFDFSGSSKADRLIITYCYGPDLYNMSFFKKNRYALYSLVQHYDEVYFDQLRELFGNVTGLETHLPNILFNSPNIVYAHIGD